MRIFEIPKKSGGMRRVYAPSREELAILGALLSELTVTTEPLDCWHGFTIGRGPLTNAQAHRCFAFSLCFDLADFFDSVKRELPGLASFSETRWDACFPDGAARQGLPTSPILANIAARALDEEFLKLIGAHAVYTRYADDLTFSSDSKDCLDTVMEMASEIVERHGFKLNPKKTRFQDARYGRRNITGLAVDNECHVTRSSRRKLRAAEYSGDNTRVAEGLQEWAKLVQPGSKRKRMLKNFGCKNEDQFKACSRFDMRYSTSIGQPAVLRPDLKIGRKLVYFLPLSEQYHCDKTVITEKTAKGSANPSDIRRMNAEEARLAIEAMGEEKYLAAINAKAVHKDDWGELFDLGAYRLVKLINSTANPDGTVNTYFRSVPNTCQTARAAIAWTFGLQENEYAPDSMS